ncbi:MAG TPA: gliding motility-associated C-terminal domain-containing protein [Bacteroidetes bacterium]|nr:gliding motility-associated C-terminal domain-containing protein [Bacteroidota bacterium]
MKNIVRFVLASFFLAFFATSSFATHNRAGNITVEQLGDCTSNRVKATVETWTKASSVTADRDSVTICWGDGECDLVGRTNGNGNGEVQGNDIKYNIYTFEHNYPGPGHYIISMTDPNRNGGIVNVNPPGSDNVQFHVQTGYTLFDGQNQGCNNSPVLKNDPVDFACIGEVFTHNPGAYDRDGDSLSYQLIVPMQDVNTPVPNYTFPPLVNAPNGCCIDVNPLTGELTWNAPHQRGEYNVAMIIVSWRNGMPIDTTVRDMQILVFDCDDNHAPQIEAPDEICVIAGDTVEFQVIATDPDIGDKIKLSAQGAPFLLDISPASDYQTWRPDGSPSADYENQPVVKTFRWQTACEHISDLHYSVVFKATDDFFLDDILDATSGLAASKTVRIKVVGPPPLDVQAEPSSERITVSWEKPYKCEDAADDFFLSFAVWRKIGNGNFDPDECEPGLDGSGYSFLAYTLDEVNGRYQYIDENVERGKTYCYRILGRFAKRTATGRPYNVVESLASDKVCVQLSRDVPLITNVSINQTATSNGEIDIRWIKPVAEDLDTLLNPGPYVYELRRTQGFAGGSFETIATFTAPDYTSLTQNQYTDQVPALDTKGSPYAYEIAFFVNNETEPIGSAPSASSVFLEIEPTDNRNNLSWSFEVPWVNTGYTVFRWNNAIMEWDSIGNVTEPFFSDTGLINGREYCYYVKAYGSYGIDGIPEPLINLSQEACAVPVDNVPPCPPELAVTNICDENRTCQEDEVLENYLDWINPMELCEETDDVVSYNIYFGAIEGEDLALIAMIDDSGTTVFSHAPDRGIAGCYAVTALDTFANESNFSNIVCVDNCPNFDLPNAFTPNGDGSNDAYIPFPFCFIERIEISIFNRWGQLVYETNDPNINWQGKNLNGDELPAGTYFYTCKVFEQRVAGTVEAPELLKGYIDLIK